MQREGRNQQSPNANETQHFSLLHALHRATASHQKVLVHVVQDSLVMLAKGVRDFPPRLGALRVALTSLHASQGHALLAGVPRRHAPGMGVA